MTANKPVVLAVDDDRINLAVIKSALSAEYEVVTAENGEEALRTLRMMIDHVNVVLLDIMMPVMDGMETLRQIKADPRLRNVPVALQTALDDTSQIAEGLKAGCFYYLTKPLELELLRELVATAVRDYRQLKALHGNLSDMKTALAGMDESEFHFRTRREATLIAALLANVSSSPDLLGMGLMELMLNAVEHGNLGISYNDKTDLLRDNRFEAEIERRLEQPEYAGRFATVRYRRSPAGLEFTVTDQGSGFDWSEYLEMSPERLMDNHGRGIAMAKGLAFTRLEYQGKGNVVTTTFTERPASA